VSGSLTPMLITSKTTLRLALPTRPVPKSFYKTILRAFLVLLSSPCSTPWFKPRRR